MSILKKPLISLEKRIYISFSVLIFIFAINGAISIFTLNDNNRLSKNIATVIEPSLKVLEDFEDVLIQSKMNLTSWVFMSSAENDKAELTDLHLQIYPELKSNINRLIAKWDNRQMADTLAKTLHGFEKLLDAQQSLMLLLHQKEDYNDVTKRMHAELLLKQEVIPQTSILIIAVKKLVAYQQFKKAEQYRLLRDSSYRLTILISILSVLIVIIGILLSVYLSAVIINPINKISSIINDLGRGITRKVEHSINNDEIGNMMVSVNNLSEKLRATARFATEIGSRNFDTEFKPLSEGDTLGIALLAMRERIKIADNNLNEAQHLAHVGNWERIIKTNRLNLSDEMINIFGIDKSTFQFNYESLLKFIHPEDLEYVKDQDIRNQYTEPSPYECRIIAGNKTVKYIYVETKIVLDDTGIPEKAFGIVQDITKRKKDEALLRKSENSLEIKNKELLTKNKELEQFAYVASHDLQEPLKTTSSFVDLLQRKYQGKLDEKADQYLQYISSASERMQTLIKHLLDYSLIGNKHLVQNIDCNKVVEEVTMSLRDIIKNTSAVIRYSPLPVIDGYETEIRDLFLHLISNAIKFRKKDVNPLIRIGSMSKGDYWEFFVNDNGIGIEEEYKERIFVIFQRLHNRNEYEGSGIGLSYCRKIVELHKGKIWLESAVNEGTTFYFTLSKNPGQDQEGL